MEPQFDTSTASVHNSQSLLLDQTDVRIKSSGTEVQTIARFYFNHQESPSVWLELPPGLSLARTVEVVAENGLRKFEATNEGIKMAQSDGQFSVAAVLYPTHDPIDFEPVRDLIQVTFAVLDFPIPRLNVPKAWVFAFPCAHFEVTVTGPDKDHAELLSGLSASPRAISHSGMLRTKDGTPFGSDALVALATVETALSFAAGRWIGVTLVKGRTATSETRWLRWGIGKSSPPQSTYSWYDRDHPEWISGICNGILSVYSRDQGDEVFNTAFYWYIRSNGYGSGLDGSLILTQCALELLSWFVIVKVHGALSEEGYGQLANAADKFRLALSLLGIPAGIPAGLQELRATAATLKDQWKTGDIADAVVGARNYLIHPTQSRKGKRRAQRDYPWYELFQGAQRTLELMLLRLIGYSGDFHDRTKVQELNRILRVPW